jgi:hypothetical protein
LEFGIWNFEKLSHKKFTVAIYFIGRGMSCPSRAKRKHFMQINISNIISNIK